VNHRIQTLLTRAAGHKVETVSGVALLPDGQSVHLANAPLVRDKHTGAMSIRWGDYTWPVLDRDTLALGFPGEAV
jgi:hypothetical protein